jgi:hypothetical protein
VRNNLAPLGLFEEQVKDVAMVQSRRCNRHF